MQTSPPSRRSSNASGGPALPGVPGGHKAASRHRSGGKADSMGACRGAGYPLRVVTALKSNRYLDLIIRKTYPETCGMWEKIVDSRQKIGETLLRVGGSFQKEGVAKLFDARDFSRLHSSLSVAANNYRRSYQMMQAMASRFKRLIDTTNRSIQILQRYHQPQ